MNLVLLIAILIIFYDPRVIRSSLIVFILGFLYDLIMGSLGLSSLFFLLIALLVFLYHKRVDVDHLLFQITIILVSDRLYSLVRGRAWPIMPNLIYFSVLIIILILINRFKTSRQDIRVEI